MILVSAPVPPCTRKKKKKRKESGTRPSLHWQNKNKKKRKESGTFLPFFFLRVQGGSGAETRDDIYRTYLNASMHG